MPRSTFRTALSLVLAFAAHASAQSIVFSTAADHAASPVPVFNEEIHRFDTNGRWPVMTRETLGLLFGDVNANGIFDDAAPINIDALQATGLPGIEAYWMSITATVTLPGGQQILDGDIFRFTPTGVVIGWHEAFFTAATGTTDVDVDAFAIGPLGEIYFSFADDEVTTSPTMIALNGGSSTLSKSCLFRIDPGQSTAVIHLTAQQAVAVFDHAFSSTASSIVNLTDVEIDPANPGALLLTCASTSQAFRGKIASTANGGQQFMVGSTPIGPPALGLTSTVSIDGLALADGPRIPLLRMIDPTPSVTTTPVATVISTGWAPGELVQFVVTGVNGARPAFTPLVETGFGWTPLDLGSPLFLQSFSTPEWLATADSTGSVSYSYSPAGLNPGTRFLVQAVSLPFGRTSTPASITFLP